MTKRTDSNQTPIVNTLRQVGLSVAITSNIGNGFPDIVTGGLMPCPHCNKKFPQNKLVELKTAKGVLTPDQKEFHKLWRGNIITVFSEQEALDAHGILLRNNNKTDIKSDKQLLLDVRRTMQNYSNSLHSMIANIDQQLTK